MFCSWQDVLYSVCFQMWCCVTVATSMFSAEMGERSNERRFVGAVGNICGQEIAWELEARSSLGRKSIQYLCSCIDGFRGCGFRVCVRCSSV